MIDLSTYLDCVPLSNSPSIFCEIQVGGATGTIGDPSGKSTERQPMTSATLAKNVAGIDAQFQRFFVRGRAYAERRGYTVQGSGGRVKVVNNKTWFGKLSALDFLGDIGRYARVGTMIARDR